MILALCGGLVVATLPSGQCAEVRQPAVAGRFYPSSASVLETEVRKMLADAEPKAPRALQNKRPLALIVPHAGYMFSAPTAATAFKLLQGKEKPSRIVLMGPSHYVRMTEGCSIPEYTAYKTPLGQIPLDQEAIERLAANRSFHKTTRVHQKEHCIEVELPFLQCTWDKMPPIVPIIVGQLGAQRRREVASAVGDLLDRDTLLVVSSDFTHYGPPYLYTPFAGTPESGLRSKIKNLDMRAVGYIEALDAVGFGDFLFDTGATICGRASIHVLLELLSRSDSIEPVFLEWNNSGDMTGSHETCVSYVAMAFYANDDAYAQLKGNGNSAKRSPPAGAAPCLDEDEKRALLKLARRAIMRRFEEDSHQPRPERRSDGLREPYGAYVNLRVAGRLRGRAAYPLSSAPLWSCVRALAIRAAFEDARFSPVKQEELPGLEIQISVLGAPKKVSDPENIELGRDGLMIRRGERLGVLLPGAAVEHGWSRAEFLAQACQSAGLAPDAWKESDVTIYSFQATVFSEKELDL